MKKILFLSVLGMLILAACSNEEYSDDVQGTGKGMLVNPIRALQKAITYFNENGNDMTYLTTRGYKPQDLKCKVSRVYHSNDSIIIQTPVIKLLADSAATVDSLKKEPVRTYAFTLMNPFYEIQKIVFVENTPSREYHVANVNKIFYDNLTGEESVYDPGNKVSWKGYLMKGKKLLTRDPYDSLTPIYPPDSLDYPVHPEDSLQLNNYPYDGGEDSTQVNTAGNDTPGGGSGPGNASQSTEQNRTPEQRVALLRNGANHITANAYPRFIAGKCGKCGAHVSETLRSMGLNFYSPEVLHNGKYVHYAEDFGPALIKVGFMEIDKRYDREIGDIRVFPHTSAAHPAGHVDMWNGKHWVSDFIEINEYPGKMYLDEYNSGNYKVYRLK